MKSIWSRLSKKRVLIFCALVAIGIIFILFSEYNSKEKTRSDQSFDESSYTMNLEKKLADFLSNLEGISDVNVMITLEGSPKTLYEAGPPQSLAAGAGTSDPYASYGLSGSKQSESVLTSVTTPEIRGVSVVCKGAGNAALRQKIVGLISGALNLSVNRIYVTE